MNESRRSPLILIFAITMLVALPTPSPAQVRVLISGGFSAAYQELLPQFEKSTGITVTTARGASQGDGNGPITIDAELRRGQPADVVILSREGLAELLAEGRIVIGSGVDFVGTIPADLQFVQVFAAAVVKGAKNPEASKRLIEFLASEKATPTVEKTGMKRPALRDRDGKKNGTESQSHVICSKTSVTNRGRRCQSTAGVAAEPRAGSSLP
jgi:ABC-type molybdate transport system substrate-binding protein